MFQETGKEDGEGPKRLCLVCGDTASGFHYGVAVNYLKLSLMSLFALMHSTCEKNVISIKYFVHFAEL